MSSSRPAEYYAFLLRFWREGSAGAESGAAIWRFSLEGTQTGERYGFADFESLAAFVVSMMQRQARSQRKPDDKENQ